MADNRSKIDPVHMLQRSFDEESNSFHMHMTNLDMQMELNAADGDSVLAKRETIEIKVDDIEQEIDCNGMVKICMLGSASVMVIAIMEDNQEIELMSITSGEIKDICIKKIKVSQPCYIILQS